MFHDKQNSLLLLLSIIGMLVLLQGEIMSEEIRKPAVAGQFYPGKADELKKMIDGYLAEAEVKHGELPMAAIIVPHAGYVFSGRTAAWGFKQLEGRKYDTAIIIGASHQIPFGFVSVYTGDKWRTPLGTIDIDKDLAKALMERSTKYKPTPDYHQGEHSLEVEVPFLQIIQKEIKILPLLLGQISYADQVQLGKDLAEVIKKGANDKKILIVCSTDLSHYPDYETAKKVDAQTIDAMVEMDTEKLESLARKNEGRVRGVSTICCGQGAVVATITAMKQLGASKATRLFYQNSGDSVYGEHDRVVGYGAVAFFMPQSARSKEKSLHDPEVQEEMLDIARKTLKTYIKEQKLPDIEVTHDILKEKRGVFVTLNKKGQLRGCIGYIEPIKPLYQAIMENAVNASTKDYRFPTVKESELKDIEIEISVLTIPKKIDSLDEFVIGKHGIILQKGMNQAVYLPQVAPEQGWNKEQTVSSLCRKAGLPPDAWKEGATFKVFEAIVFHEGK